MKNQTESIKEPKQFNPKALLQIAEAGDNLHFEVTDIGEEQCVVVAVSGLHPDSKQVFSGSPRVIEHSGKVDSNESTTDDFLDWREWTNELQSMAGEAGIEIQTSFAGHTGRQKELQIGLFDLHNGEELMKSLHQLNDMLRAEGTEPGEGLPDNIAYLPENLLIATKNIRSEVKADLNRVQAAVNAARNAGAIAVHSKGMRQ